MGDEIIIGTGRVVEVKEVVKNGSKGTQSIVDFGASSVLRTPSTYDSAPIQKVMLNEEVRYGKTYEIVLREVTPDLVKTSNSRKFQEP